MWMLGVGAVYEFPKKFRLVEDLDSVQLMSAEVSIPNGQGGFDAREYIKFALGRLYLVSEFVVRHGFWGGCLVVMRKACNMGPKRPCGSMVKGIRTMFLL